MPKVSMNYQNSVIYKLVCKNINVKAIYVGSTTNFTKRLACHKSDCSNIRKRNYNLVVYRYIRVTGGFVNWNMILIERYPCHTRFEKESRERYWIESLNATLNIVIPTRTHKEYYQKNADKLVENQQEYRQNNNNLIECNCGKITIKYNMSHHNKTKIHQKYLAHLKHNYPKNKPLLQCTSCNKKYRTFNITTPFICHSCK